MLVTKHEIYHMWVLQRYLQLLEQYLALCYVLKLSTYCRQGFLTL